VPKYGEGENLELVGATQVDLLLFNNQKIKTRFTEFAFSNFESGVGYQVRQFPIIFLTP